MHAQIILYGQRSRGALLLRALQEYIRSLARAHDAIPGSYTAARDVLSTAIAEAEDAETDLVATINASLPPGPGDFDVGLSGQGDRRPRSPPNGDVLNL